MSELLYNKSKAVEELNKVEGFYPLELARVISNEGQEEQRYLDVKYRKLWFRLVNPTGKIISRIVHFTENMAVVEARIYLDKCDQEDNYIANSFSQKFRTADTQFGDKFLEMAETAAIGRALADAGYGLQFADVGEGNDPMQVDAGIPVNQGTDADCDASTNPCTRNAADSQSVSRNHAIISASSNSGAADDGTVLSRSTSQWKYDWRGNGYRTDDKSGNESGNWICTSYAADAF